MWLQAVCLVFTDTCRVTRCFSLIVEIGNNKIFFCLLAACAANCETCSVEGKCDTCKTGFIVKSDKSACLGQCFFVPFLKAQVKSTLLIPNLMFR